MTRFSMMTICAACAAVLMACAPLRAEEPAPDKPKAPDAPKAAPTPDRGGRTRGFGGGGGFPGGGNMQDRIQQFGGMMGGGGTGGVIGMISRMVGFEIEDPKATPKIDALPLGASKRMVVNIPVGGVNNFNPTGAGWKVETVFKLTDEQTKATDALREEYAAEEKKLKQELLDAEKALAAKAIELRQKYEKKANELLTGADKEAKEKMDALAAEVNAKNAATVAETVPLYDTKDWQQGIVLIRALRDKTTATKKDAEDKLVTLVPEENRARIQETLKTQNEARARQNQWQQPGADQNGGMRRRGQNDTPVVPPKAPEGDKF